MWMKRSWELICPFPHYHIMSSSKKKNGSRKMWDGYKQKTALSGSEHGKLFFSLKY